jgi:axial budding pattern protein 2
MISSYILISAIFASPALSKLSVNIAISDQLPLIARVNTPYEWTISQDTFSTADPKRITYSTVNLPPWLSFNPASLTLSGQPSDKDIGDATIKVSAADGKDTASSTFTIPVTTLAPPHQVKPFVPQFSPNPSLSSVFQLHNGSALTSPNPSLRVPPKWSFSVGFNGKSFKGSDDVFYSGLMADGAPLPSWLKFNPEDITFNGVSPSADGVLPVHLALIVSDVQGYRSTTLPFDLIIASHELSMTEMSLPTINVTSDASFNISLNSAADFAGVLFDNTTFDPVYLTELKIDVFSYTSWLSYDTFSRTLSGTPPATFRGEATLAVTITAAGNQSVTSKVSLDVTPPFFLNTTIPSISVSLGQTVLYDLSQNIKPSAKSQDVQLTASIDSNGTAGTFLHFDVATLQLSGTIPDDFAEPSMEVTFVAYSANTHSTSHANLIIRIPNARLTSTSSSNDSAGSSEHRRKALKAVWVTSAVLCGLLLFGLALALFRRYAREPDPAETGEANTRGFSMEDKRWYGLDNEGVPQTPDTAVDEKAPASPHIASNSAMLEMGGAVRKADFVAKLRAGAKAMSETVRSVCSSRTSSRPPISKPFRPASEGMDVEIGSHIAHLFDDVSHNTDSSSTNTDRRSEASVGGRSLPHRRPDFLPPSPLARSISFTSTKSSSTTGSGAISEEAVVQTASRARSMRSIQRSSAQSVAATLPTPVMPSPAQARLVPFTSAAKVPPPNPTPHQGHAATPSVSPLSRMSSQRAVVERESVDEWALSATYVRTLGEDGRHDDRHLSLSTIATVPEPPRGLCSPRLSASSYSLASSKLTTRDDLRMGPPRALARVGQRFKLRLTVPHRASILVRLEDGGVLPAFIEGGASPGVVELWGVPRPSDIGIHGLVVVDGGTEEQIGMAIVDVVGHE